MGTPGDLVELGQALPDEWRVDKMKVEILYLSELEKALDQVQGMTVCLPR